MILIREKLAMKIILSLSIGVFTLTGCATPEVIPEREVTDSQLSCAEIESEIKEAAEFEEKAREEKGVTGTNTAAAIFFWPALFATYANADDAIDAAQDRQDHLHRLYEKKDC